MYTVFLETEYVNNFKEEFDIFWLHQGRRLWEGVPFQWREGKQYTWMKLDNNNNEHN